jgi:hypothetical protein
LVKEIPMAAKKKQAEEQLPAVADFGEYDGAGFENVDGEHLKIPFIVLLQGLSPQTKKENDEYIEGAEPGMLMNSVTKELYPEGVEFIPACVDHCYVEWVPRKRGGGFIGRHELTSDTVREAKANAAGSLKLKVRREVEEDGEKVTVINDLVETFYVAGVLVLDNGVRVEPAILAATSTKIAPYKGWMTRANMFTVAGPNGSKQRPPLFAHRLKITTKGQSNAHGDFSNFVITPAVENDIAKSLITNLDSPLFLGGRDVRKLLGSGEASFDYESQNAASGTEEVRGDDDF